MRRLPQDDSCCLVASTLPLLRMEERMTDTDELRQLLADATPGPWRTHDTWLEKAGYTVVVFRGGNETAPPRLTWLPTFSHEPWDHSLNAWADAELIAAAVNALPGLLGEIDRLRVGDEIARRRYEGWHPQFHVNPAKCAWVHWSDDETSEPMTPEQVQWYAARRAEQ